ncbi:enoyl-CoA hydratase-related protein [Sphingomonas sp. MG17]|uniref:Enoyl-CoA hydratase-related protein n=1 Tax=Sphingomonas tagetis TaxID=2949092 RepID=A0A9X2KLW7_9SPHN|nr:enoyl-CoA hydratase-related protein [Sphingomonas tagetis]MCP3731260.1 enoyl-CoA hydratase-related protein [Sphingomonas tagetis]
MSIDVTRDGGVATVTINRPERKNAITMGMRQSFQGVFQDLGDDDDIRAIVLRGASSDFSAGADVGEMGQGGVRGNMVKSRTLGRMVRSVAHTNKPVIAAVQGVCIGMSFALALSADFIVAAEDARFQLAFRHIGLAMDGAAGWLLERHIGVMRAKEIAYSGRFVNGREAAELGFALEALPSDEVQTRAAELAASFATAPTLALSQMKRQFDAAPGQSLDDALEFEAAVQALMTWTEDFAEGSTAFKEKRKPAYRGA